MKKKDYVRIDEAVNRHMESLANQRDYEEAARHGLFILGEELYNNGFDFDDFFADVVFCFISPKDQIDSVYSSLLAKYSSIEKFPRVEVLIKLFTNKNFLKTVENGFNHAKRYYDINKKKK